nr:class I SAM-dependent methyltransferase [Verticiella sp. GG226]
MELGCSAGGNLLPFALAYPEAQVVGIDLSVVEVEAGRQVAAAVGAKNLDLRAMSLTDITPEFGQFDYIIAVQMKCLATWGDVIHSKRKKPPTRDGVGGVSASRQFLHSRLAWGPFARRPCLARAYCTN